MFDIGTLLRGERAEDRIERRCDLVDAGAQLAGSVLLPQFCLLGLGVGERALEQGRMAPATRDEQLVEAFHLARRHFPVAVGEAQEHHHRELDDDPRLLSKTNRHDKPLLNGSSAHLSYGASRRYHRSGACTEEIAGNAAEDGASGVQIAAEKVVDNVAWDSDHLGGRAHDLDRGGAWVAGNDADLAEHSTRIAVAKNDAAVLAL